jgi:hypothetical protein
VTADTHEVQRALGECLVDYLGQSCTLVSVRRKPYNYSTSFALEELEVELSNGTSMRVIFKNLGSTGLLPGARASKPAFLFEPLREIQTYQRLLSGSKSGTATCYGAVADQDSNRYWLFLERVDGLELYQVGDVAVWAEVAAWLAGMHSCAALQVHTLRQRNPYLISYDATHYRRWLHRATSYMGHGGLVAQRRSLAAVAEGLEVALGRFAELPRTLLHGEFYASNVLVGGRPEARRICPVDWEMAGVGPALLDLGALCAGWDEDSRLAIARSYHQAWAAGGWAEDETTFLTYLQCCELCLAVQWLGWEPNWQAPPEHARDWFDVATRLAACLIQ